MELALAFILFALLVVAWLALPSTAVAAAPAVEAPAWATSEGLQVATAEALR